MACGTDGEKAPVEPSKINSVQLLPSLTLEKLTLVNFEHRIEHSCEGCGNALLARLLRGRLYEPIFDV